MNPGFVSQDLRLWAVDAKQCWATRRKPKHRDIEADFATDELETGKILLNNKEFELTPTTACGLYPIFAFARTSTCDYYLLPLLYATLIDHKRTGLSDLVADFLLDETEAGLRGRFSPKEMLVIRRYFKLLAKYRGWRLPSEIVSDELLDKSFIRFSLAHRHHAERSLSLEKTED